MQWLKLCKAKWSHTLVGSPIGSWAGLKLSLAPRLSRAELSAGNTNPLAAPGREFRDIIDHHRQLVANDNDGDHERSVNTVIVRGVRGTRESS
jgi:hypothetical protein